MLRCMRAVTMLDAFHTARRVKCEAPSMHGSPPRGNDSDTSERTAQCIHSQSRVKLNFIPLR